MQKAFQSCSQIMSVGYALMSILLRGLVVKSNHLKCVSVSKIA